MKKKKSNLLEFPAFIRDEPHLPRTPRRPALAEYTVPGWEEPDEIEKNYQRLIWEFKPDGLDEMLFVRQMAFHLQSMKRASRVGNVPWALRYAAQAAKMYESTRKSFLRIQKLNAKMARLTAKANKPPSAR